MQPDASALGDVFARLKNRFDQQSRDGLICKQGSYGGCMVLKLQKPSWTNDPMDVMEKRSGIFFSVWTDGKFTTNHRINYNIHALKLRELRGYSIQSRDFAHDFRSAFAAKCGGWPEVSVEYGPQTLMQGSMDGNTVDREEKIFGLLTGFQTLSPVIDRLLEARRRSPRDRIGEL